MSIRPSSVEFCVRCKRPTPRLRRGECTVCRSKQRRGRRLAKTSTQGGSGLARFSDLLKLAWDLWSVWIRARAAGCAMCGTPLPPEKLQGAHGITRQARRVMFDDRNVWALCSACHRRNSPAGPAWFEWMQQQLGDEEYGRLRWAADHGPKLTADALQLYIVADQLGVAQLPEGPRKEWARERVRVINERQSTLGVRCA